MQAAQVVTAPELKGELRYDEPMARHVSWRAGGKAKQYFIPADLDDIAQLIASLPKDEKIMWMGLGSNTLFRDEGFDGTVIAMQGVMNELELIDGAQVYAGAGVSCAKLARFCARNQLQGAEWFAGIPGLIGGALAMNAGAFGGETWQHVISVETLDHDGARHKRSPDEYKVGYRSVQGPENEWFTAATFEFERGEGSVTDIKALLARRAATQPTGVASCGSVFTNPEQVLKDLTGDGETKRIWFAHQRIIANAQVMGETATVEVTFVDKEESEGYRTKFGLHLKNGEWRIYSFKTFTE